MSLTKFREQLLVQHSMEIEKINDRHRSELKKYHVSALFAFVRYCSIIYSSFHV